MNCWVNEVSFSKIGMIIEEYIRARLDHKLNIRDMSETDIRQTVGYTNLEVKRQFLS